eukprot:TRINITY_DN14196_c0_g1_i1.p1 TRINITY_DN14196_c0_g1~~TRINITY_DN14196_c0_g1_i1.p1  ORF type:complete len:583 (+),score=173.45 TRINITY_DN14196_c0_g1_i1:51-1751(+)
MVCTILTSADLFGTKLNYELDFPKVPNVEELRHRAEQVFGAEAGNRRPAGVPTTQTFKAHRMQTFDDGVELWVDLVNSTQLQDFAQVYIFQKETHWHKEVQSKIPPPVKPPVPVVVQASPPKRREEIPVGLVPTPTPEHLASPSPVHLVSQIEATHQEKTRIVYEELDATKRREVTRDDWQTAFDRVQLAEYEADLFVKTDRNKDNVVSFQEFQVFADLYPTLLDALYYRLRDFWLVKQQEDSISVSLKTLDVLRERETAAREEVVAATHESIHKESALTAQMNEVVVAQGRERDAMAVMEASAQETERCRTSVATNVADLQSCKEQESVSHINHIAGLREVETHGVKLKLAEEETHKATLRLQDIMRLLEEQQIEVAKKKEFELSTAADLVSEEAKARNLAAQLEASQGQTRLATDRLSVAETELTQAQERERECGVVHLQAREEAIRQLAKKEQTENELLVSKELVLLKQQDEDAASRSVQAQLKATETLQETCTNLLARCMTTREEEAPLIVQEVRLRDARDNLEAEEARLRTDHQHFHTSSQRSTLPSPRAVIPSITASPRR